jgi:hypothetical protein
MNDSAEDLGVSLRLHVIYFQNRTGGGGVACEDPSLRSEECVGRSRQLVLLRDWERLSVRSESVNDGHGEDASVDMSSHFVTDPGSLQYVFVIEVCMMIGSVWDTGALYFDTPGCCLFPASVGAALKWLLESSHIGMTVSSFVFCALCAACWE